MLKNRNIYYKLKLESAGAYIMAERLKKLITVQDVMDEYMDGSYRKVKNFLLQNMAYKKIGNSYYFSREEVERKLLSPRKTEFKVDY